MDGEFKVQLKKCNQATITKLFNDKYQNKLRDAYFKSAHKDSGTMKEKDFCAGYHNNDSLFLVYTLEANILKIYVETVNKKDLNLMKNTINMYFQQVIGILNETGQKWSNPQATISLENCPFYGSVKTRRKH